MEFDKRLTPKTFELNKENLESLRLKIVQRLREKYSRYGIDEEFLQKFEKGEVKPEIDSMVGDCYATITQELGIRGDMIEKVRAELFRD
jgi:hypothetical protein